MGARAPTSWERREGARPFQGFRPLDPLTHTITEGRAPDSRSGTTGHGGVHPLLRMAGHAGQREANKKLTKVYCLPRKRSPK